LTPDFCPPDGRIFDTPKYQKGVTDMTEGYDKTAKKVNEEIAKLGEGGTFSHLAEIDKKLGSPKGTSFEYGGYADYFEFMGDD
jgi:hypothetical protein